MAFSKRQKKSLKGYPALQDEEPVLIFHGPRMRKGQGISMIFEDMQVKYLVRYPSGTGVTPGVVTCLPYAQPQLPPPSRAQAQETKAASSGAKASTSRAGPSTSKGSSSTSKAGPSTSKAGPSTSKAGPSTSKAGPSTSKAGPSTSKATPSTSKATPSTSKATPSTSKAGPSTSKAGPSTSKATPSTSKAGPSTSKAGPSTSEATPSTSEAGPSTSEATPSASEAASSASEAYPSASEAASSTSEAASSASEAASSASEAAPTASKVGPSSTRPYPTTNRFSTRRPEHRSTSLSRGGQSTGGAAAQGDASRNSGSTGSSVSEFLKDDAFSSVACGWDYEWIPETRVLRYSTAQLKKDSDSAIQMARRKEYKQKGRFQASGSRSFSCGGSAMGDHGDPGEGSSGLAPPPAKRSRGKLRVPGRGSWGSRGDAGDPKRDSSERSEVQFNLPKSLKPLLVQDWELVAFEKKLCNLPAKISIEAILSEYTIFPQNCHTRDKKYAVSGLVAMIKAYFNVILSTQLLYNFERPQYAELIISYPSSQLSQLYGGVHLLRLFQQLGPMLTCTPLDDNSLSVLKGHLQDFLEYLAQDPSLLFIEASDYEVASEEYLKVAL